MPPGNHCQRARVWGKLMRKRERGPGIYCPNGFYTAENRGSPLVLSLQGSSDVFFLLLPPSVPLKPEADR